jgi:hypothetical protein
MIAINTAKFGQSVLHPAPGQQTSLIRIGTPGRPADASAKTLDCGFHGLPSARRKRALSGRRGQGFDPLGESAQRRVGEPEIGKVAHGARKILAVGAAAAGSIRNDPRSLV